MSIRRDNLFNDPKSGASYLFGAKLPSSHMNEVLGALRRLEAAAYQSISRNWGSAATVTASSAAVQAAALDKSLGMWVVFWHVTFTPAAKSTIGGAVYRTISLPSTPNGFLPFSAASSGAGKFVVVGEPSSATADKVLESTDGVTWNLRSLTTSSTDQATVVIWDPASALFVCALNPGQLDTSPDGITWTARTVPGSLSAATFGAGASNELSGSDALILVTAGSGTGYMTSPDGINWTAQTFPVTGLGDLCTYAKGAGRWMVGDIGGPTLYTSADGITWSSTNAPTGATEVDSVVGFGDVFIASWLDASGNAHISLTEDNGSTWIPAFDLNSTDIFELFESDRQVLTGSATGSVRLSHVY